MNIGDYERFVHFKDFMEVSENGHCEAVDGTGYRGTVIGEGEVPLKEIVDFLCSRGYEGYMSIEFEGDGDPDEGTVSSIEYA